MPHTKFHNYTRQELRDYLYQHPDDKEARDELVKRFIGCGHGGGINDE